jgi:hypothetical protein
VIRALLIALTIGVATTNASVAYAQEPPKPPRSAVEPAGFLPEPEPLTRVTIFVDRHLGKVDLTNGFYVDFANLVLGTGWVSAGPGYRHWYSKDRVFVDGSFAVSSNGSRRAQARFELPALAKSRVTLGVQGRRQDLRDLTYFEAGPRSGPNAIGAYRLRSTELVGYITLRPVRWLALSGESGVIHPRAAYALDDLVPAPSGSRTFIPTGVSLAIDARDFPSHPTRGLMARAIAVRYDDRDDGTFTFSQYEAEGSAFLPIAGARVVLALHGWAIASEDNANVPFYFQPTIGGGNTLRSYDDYRFRDRSMAVVNAELRLAMTTHADLALFADSGGVAPRFTDVNLAHHSYGAGIRLHTMRMTYVSIDVAHGREGWRAILSLNDAFDLSRLLRRAIAGPAVWGIRP